MLWKFQAKLSRKDIECQNATTGSKFNFSSLHTFQTSPDNYSFVLDSWRYVRAIYLKIKPISSFMETALTLMFCWTSKLIVRKLTILS